MGKYELGNEYEFEFVGKGLHQDPDETHCFRVKDDESQYLIRKKRKCNAVLERYQKGCLNITAWIDWYLNCILHSAESVEEMLSSILDKAIFWQIHSQNVINDRQKQILNTSLDGFAGKLKVTNWAKLASISVDAAEHDVKAFISSGILVP